MSPPPLTPREIEHLYNAGLASIAMDTFDPGSSELSGQSIRTLKSADLTSRVIYGQLRSATIEILDIACRHNIPVVLLKGMSVAEDLYVEPHHRLMGDIDILVPVEQAEDLCRFLTDIGYRIPDDTATPDGHHHLPALCHPDSDVYVEVHTSLFPPTVLAKERLFEISTIWANVETAEFSGINCLKFSPEFQLLYTVMHWGLDGKWTINLISISDVILMLRREDPPVNWALIQSWLTENQSLADIFAVLLLYLDSAGVLPIPAAIKEQIRTSSRRIGTINMKVLHWLLFTFPLSGRKKVAWALTVENTRLLWGTLLEPRHKSLRLITAVARIMFRRNPGQSILGSTAGRLRTLLEPNE